MRNNIGAKTVLVGPLKAQELSDSFDYQQLYTEIYCVKKLEARIKCTTNSIVM